MEYLQLIGLDFSEKLSTELLDAPPGLAAPRITAK